MSRRRLVAWLLTLIVVCLAVWAVAVVTGAQRKACEPRSYYRPAYCAGVYPQPSSSDEE